jgi:putative DNA-invertase from lambdoid prophage Rac
VSTDRQADEGESIAVQERTVAGYAQMRGLTVERIFSERGVSGSKPLAERLEGRALLDALQLGDTVITPKHKNVSIRFGRVVEPRHHEAQRRFVTHD